MSNGNWNPTEETALAEYIASRVIECASGRSEDECHFNFPRDVYFIGNLRPRQDRPDPEQHRRAYLEEILNKLSPVAFGAEFLLKSEGPDARIYVTLSWSCYYRVFPKRSQQINHTVSNADVTENADDQQDANSVANTQPIEISTEQDNTVIEEQEAEDRTAEVDSPEVTESAYDRRAARTVHDDLFIRFKKIKCCATASVLLQVEQDTWSADTSELSQALANEIARAQEIVNNDPESICTKNDPGEKVRVPEDALASDHAYDQFCQTLQNPVNPVWGWEVRCELQQRAGTELRCRVLTFEFINTTPMQCDNQNTEPYFFDTRAEFSFVNCKVLPFEMNITPRNFRYNRQAWGKGINCGIIQPNEPGSPYYTTHTPKYTQRRYATKSNPKAFFSDLADDPIPVLESILLAMEEYLDRWAEAEALYAQSVENWTPKFENKFRVDRDCFDSEIERFRRGLELIKTNDPVREAFCLTNETFNRAGRGHKVSWRLFQVVFLVSQIPGIAALECSTPEDSAEREIVDIIFFPTGGGKTEAYLGTIVFHCFFDRLRGKTAGVTAWTRFPLRLLTLQQTQRVADVIGLAEIIRLEQSDPRLKSNSVDGFAVGYFVGQGGSPNEIADPENVYRSTSDMLVTWSKVNDPTILQDWKRVVRCPACNTKTVRLDFDPDSMRLIHRCPEEGCPFPSGVIPVYVVDNEIYRYLPCVIVGTIDKLAGIGNQRKFSQIFGQLDGRCSVHGYYKGKCCQKDCNDVARLQGGVPEGLSAPSLFVQDELHLLKEGLGTFDSHYETFTQELRRQFGETSPLKIIASSATIEAFERQVIHLYGKQPGQARVFPGAGPILEESFYAKTLVYPQRIFVGVIPHNKTIFNTILEMIEYYHREVHLLRSLPAGSTNPYGGTVSPGTLKWQKLLDLYVTSLTYFLANRELNSLRTDLEADVLPCLEREAAGSFEIHELTGSTGTDDVARILDKLERPLAAGTPPDALLATSMVSHGVDIDRLNAMIFYGMPRQNAEYIQASSRVGRAHVGIVFNCLHPVRERDQSHYGYFVKFHEFLGQLVEPVAINRWSKFSVNRTLPGLFMGVLLQLVANRYTGNPNRFYILDFVKQQITNGNLNEADFIEILERAYQVQNANTLAKQNFRMKIQRMIPQFIWDQIVGTSSGRTFVSEVLIPQPMRSLRDVDEPVEIELDSMGSQWVARADTGGGV
jgi:hypothetical protein